MKLSLTILLLITSLTANAQSRGLSLLNELHSVVDSLKCPLQRPFDYKTFETESSQAASIAAIRAYFPDLTEETVQTYMNEQGTLRSAMIKAYENSHYGHAVFRLSQSVNPGFLHSLMLNESPDIIGLDNEGRYVMFVTQDTKADSMFLYELFDAEKRLRTPLFRAHEMNRLLTPYATEQERPLRGKPYIHTMQMSQDGQGINFMFGQTHLCYNIKEHTIGPRTDKLPERPNFRVGDYRHYYCADSTYYITAWGHDLYLYRTETGDSIRITADGEFFHSFAASGQTDRYPVQMPQGSTQKHIIQKDIPLGVWLGKSHSYAVIREDNRHVLPLTVVENLAQPRPRNLTMKYAMPGDTLVKQYELYILDADSAHLRKIPEFNAYKDQIIDMPRYGRLDRGSDGVYFIRKSRYQDTIDLCYIDARTQQLRVIIHEPCAPHLNEQLFEYHILNKGKNILWWSQRNGRGQYFLYDNNGKLLNAVTPPDMVAGHVERFDSVTRTLLFAGYGHERGANPVWKYHYKVRLDGKRLVCLTPEPGNHETNFLIGGHLLSDRCSAIGQPPVFRLYDMSGHMLTEVARTDVSALQANGWKGAKAMQVTAADGVTQLCGAVYTPSWMSKDDRLPIITNPYPGPQMDQVPENFALDDNGHQTLAEMGFVVLNFSYRGSSPLRGRDFHTYGYGRLRDYAIDDDMATIRQVASAIPQADTTRVGILGHSGGGFMAATAILSHPEFYKVAISASGNHDNNIYTKWWGETFHGRGHIPTTPELAENLRGRLLLVTGDRDTNVHPASTFRLARALMDSGHLFDMLVIPGADHGVNSPYYDNLVRYYFLEHLANRPYRDADIVRHQ